MALHGDDPSTGWAFLRKLVQLPVAVPQVSDEGLNRFMEAVLGPPGEAETLPPDGPRIRPDDTPPPSPSGQQVVAGSLGRPNAGADEVPRWEAEYGVDELESSPARLGQSMSIEMPSTATPFRNAGVGSTSAASLEANPRVRELIGQRLAAQPDRSIREAKRLLNVWQFYARVLDLADPILDPDVALARARSLVILSEVVTRWPALQRHLHRPVGDRRALQVLASAAGDDDLWDAARTAAGLGGLRYDAACNNLRHLLRNFGGVSVANLASRLL
jgi:hypothetical protein